jgi:hypothetical protein
MPAERALAEADFPIVALGEATMGRVRVERMPDLDRLERFASGHGRPAALDALIDARAIEPGPRRLDGVLIRFFAKDFSGESYGLALALADKFARFPPGPEANVIATGALVPGEEGLVGTIDGFEAKARAVIAHARAANRPSLFAFPKENWTRASPAVREALEAASEAGGLILRPVERLADLADLWRAPVEPAVRRGRLLRFVVAPGVAAAAAVLAAVGIAGWWTAPLEACRGAVAALTSATARDDPRLMSRAVSVCEAGARARPGNGRLLFLTGQVHALNGSRSLADKYWRRSALAGDREGLATWGRELWLSAPGDATAMASAEAFLTQASQMGSPTAMEDLAEIFMDDAAVHADQAVARTDVARAEALLAKARAIRRDDGRQG